MQKIIKQITEIRRHLHAHPELSGAERESAAYLKAILKDTPQSKLLEDLGGNGFAVVFGSSDAKPTICFRAELDALPIEEINTFPYASKTKGVSHKCGHDGHAAILAGLGLWLAEHPDQYSGRIVLAFQTAEENAQGALEMLSDRRFLDLAPDYVFAMHNLPGFTLGQIILRDGAFASASSGVKIKLQGKTSHAGHPSDGNSPYQALVSLSQSLLNLPQSGISFGNAAMVTIIHLRLGEEAFGTSPGEAELMATYRSYSTETLHTLQAKTEALTAKIADSFGLEHSLKWVENFDATVNAAPAVEILSRAARAASLPSFRPEQPFSWSEDFSFYGSHFPACLFGMGSGMDSPQLHNPDYDFPEALIEPTIKLYLEIIKAAGGQNATL